MKPSFSLGNGRPLTFFRELHPAQELECTSTRVLDSGMSLRESKVGCYLKG